jgi:hypothetical protein
MKWPRDSGSRFATIDTRFPHAQRFNVTIAHACETVLFSPLEFLTAVHSLITSLSLLSCCCGCSCWIPPALLPFTSHLHDLSVSIINPPARRALVITKSPPDWHVCFTHRNHECHQEIRSLEAMDEREDGRRGPHWPVRRVQGPGNGDELEARGYAPLAQLAVRMLTAPGMDKMQKSMAVYVKSLSKRAEGDDKEKQLPGGHLGSTMVTHGEDFEPESEFGNCLSCMYAITMFHLQY